MNPYKKRIILETWGIKVPVISLDDLIVMKKKAAREQDLRDIQALLELKSL